MSSPFLKLLNAPELERLRFFIDRHALIDTSPLIDRYCLLLISRFDKTQSQPYWTLVGDMLVNHMTPPEPEKAMNYRR